MILSCPLPKLDFDTINLGHGSGGTLTSQLLDAGVFKLLENELLNKKHDGAIFNLDGKVAMSTDTYVVSPIFFEGGNIGDLAINGTINDLAMCGAAAKYLTLGFVLEEGLKMTEFWEILLSIKAACDAAGVNIVTGDTKVVERGKGDKIFINTTGIGTVHPKANIDAENIKAGDKIILSGPLARHGITIMSHRQGLQFESTISSDTRPLNKIILSLLDEFGENIHFLRDPTRGGLATVLNEIAAGAKLGIDIAQKNMSVEEEVAGACEMLGLDPMYVANEGLFVAVVDATVAENILSRLNEWEHGEMARIIGETTTDHPRQVIMKSLIGGRRVVNMLPGEQLPRIC
ncbi:hydrogenase expression/formation protein HypE [Mucilaginibacter gotjawali]|uniref:Hydrogenase expression/formation protein HypE n=2 Tax=Mucilaginibacter gotjawali TaxID=1550579 RepID=A0A839SD41_9SPHI|nr:hydrogenase expression/formation protein HypE [Mucilaginibacter gotjawali]MBB3056145.1 hydrogenase expression/formation protein HypE [Mucilaginibacter gotjawali]BAU53515.1 Hydrogenase expression/formation protein HypE [Mucilaginibacter gotjawali]